MSGDFVVAGLEGLWFFLWQSFLLAIWMKKSRGGHAFNEFYLFILFETEKNIFESL